MQSPYPLLKKYREGKWVLTDGITTVKAKQTKKDSEGEHPIFKPSLGLFKIFPGIMRELKYEIYQNTRKEAASQWFTDCGFCWALQKPMATPTDNGYWKISRSFVKKYDIHVQGLVHVIVGLIKHFDTLSEDPPQFNHTCGVRCCVNPEHIVPGAAKPNGETASKQHNHSDPRNSSWKLNNYQVSFIRRADRERSMSREQLCILFNISVHTLMEILHYREYPDADESWLDEFENPRKLFVSKVQLDTMKTCGLSNSVLAKIMDVSETTIDTTLTETKESDFIIRRSTRRKYTPEIDDKILKAQSNEDLKEISKEHGISFNKIKQRSYWFKRKGITKI